MLMSTSEAIEQLYLSFRYRGRTRQSVPVQCNMEIKFHKIRTLQISSYSRHPLIKIFLTIWTTKHENVRYMSVQGFNQDVSISVTGSGKLIQPWPPLRTLFVWRAPGVSEGAAARIFHLGWLLTRATRPVCVCSECSDIPLPFLCSPAPLVRRWVWDFKQSRNWIWSLQMTPGWDFQRSVKLGGGHLPLNTRRCYLMHDSAPLSGQPSVWV